MSASDAQLLLGLQQRVAALEALVAADPVTERVQRLEMRCGSLQSQINLLRNKTPVAPLDEARQDEGNAATG